ncbi:MAG: hypothetical protein NQU41_00685 [Candidatus Methanosuratincola sp.]|jgi:hypothetical protein|uniref:Uncharacterized protein n=1 Tax=Candidatus Methanosuratincola petrocarbonis (ex Vanwonterghem et al. 2016) TaxID=1867261 RepID=A0A7J3UZE4_9CREN|nr:hypothetical protein [Candidatus Methanosuratincola sp.]
MSSQTSKQSAPKPEGLYRRMYYIRVLFAVIGGLVTGGLNIRGELGIAVGVAVYLASYVFLKSFGPFRGIPDKNKYYMTGIFSYFLLWFSTWVISINLLYPSALP